MPTAINDVAALTRLINGWSDPAALRGASVEELRELHVAAIGLADEADDEMTRAQAHELGE